MTLELVPDPPAESVAPVIQLQPGKQSEITSSAGRCYHRGHFELDESTRGVSCGTCGAPLDAFKLLLQYAERERHWRYYDSELRRAKTELAELKAEERKVKARTKNAQRKEADAAVAAERVRAERERLLTFELAREIGALARRIEGAVVRGPRRPTRGDG